MATPNDPPGSAAAKRLSPRTDVARELYLLSGNECAFPGCQRRLINEKGQFIANVCHIRAAKEGGERFDPSQSDEDRRDVSNLLLMCYEHHVETNDVNEFPVERMDSIKKAHEARFRGGLEHLEAAFEDQTLAAEPTVPRTLHRLNAVLDWGNTDEELAPLITDLTALARKLADVPRSSRGLLNVVVGRGREGSFHQVIAMYEDIVQAVGGRRGDVDRHLDVLQHHDVVYMDGPYEDVPLSIVVREAADVPVTAMLKTFCTGAGIPLAALLVDLQFALLD